MDTIFKSATSLAMNHFLACAMEYYDDEELIHENIDREDFLTGLKQTLFKHLESPKDVKVKKIKSEDSDKVTCQFKLTSGDNAGKFCSKNQSKNGKYCTIHTKIMNDKKDKSKSKKVKKSKLEEDEEDEEENEEDEKKKVIEDMLDEVETVEKKIIKKKKIDKIMNLNEKSDNETKTPKSKKSDDEDEVKTPKKSKKSDDEHSPKPKSKKENSKSESLKKKAK